MRVPKRHQSQLARSQKSKAILIIIPCLKRNTNNYYLDLISNTNNCYLDLISNINNYYLDLKSNTNNYYLDLKSNKFTKPIIWVQKTTQIIITK